MTDQRRRSEDWCDERHPGIEEQEARLREEAEWRARRAKSERELDLEGALINLADLHHRTLRGSRKHDPERRKMWDCDCKTCATVMELVGDSPLFKMWKAAQES